VLASRVNTYMPQRTRKILLSLCSLGFMFYYSWQLALAVLGSILVLMALEGLFPKRLLSNIQDKNKRESEVLANLAQGSFSNKQNDFNLNANSFDTRNEEMFN